MSAGWAVLTVVLAILIGIKLGLWLARQECQSQHLLDLALERAEKARYHARWSQTLAEIIATRAHAGKLSRRIHGQRVAIGKLRAERAAEGKERT